MYCSAFWGRRRRRRGVGWEGEGGGPWRGSGSRRGSLALFHPFPLRHSHSLAFPFVSAHIRTRAHTCGPAVPPGRGGWGGGPGPSFEHTHPHHHSFFFNKNFFVEKSEFNSFHSVLIHNGPKKVTTFQNEIKKYSRKK